MNQRNLHYERYAMLLTRAAVYDDAYRESLFWIFASDTLFHMINQLYDFDENMIKDIDDLSLSTGEYALIKLAHNLYNYRNEADITEVFAPIDSANSEVAIQAIRLRFEI